MKKSLNVLAALLMSSNFASAQDQLTDAESIEDQIDAVEDSVEEDFDKEERFEGISYQEGWRGSLSLSGAASSFATELAGVETDNSQQNFTIGSRLTNGAGVWEQSIGLYYSYANEDDQEATNSLRSNYQLSRLIGDRLYGFGNLTANKNSDDILQYQGFASFGLGYRLANQPNFAWRVQGGPGYSYAVSEEDLDASGVGAVLGSRLYYQVSESAALTNDTQYTWSEDVQEFSNDIGLNFKVTDDLVTRLGYASSLKEIPNEDYSTLENSFTVSAVLSF